MKDEINELKRKVEVLKAGIRVRDRMLDEYLMRGTIQEHEENEMLWKDIRTARENEERELL